MSTPIFDAAVHALLSALAGCDTHDVNLRDHPDAHAAVETFCAVLATFPATAAQVDAYMRGSSHATTNEAAAQPDAWRSLYLRMKNVAAGYSNYCDESGSTRRLEREFDAIENDARAALSRPVVEQPIPASALPPKAFHIGAQNDALFIIFGERPALNNDYPNHEADRTCVAKVYEEALARRLVDLANASVVEQTIPAAQAGQAQGEELLLETLRVAEYAMRENGMHCHGAYQQVCRVLEASPAPAVDRGLSDEEITAGFHSMRGESGLPANWFHAGARWAEKALAASAPSQAEPRLTEEARVGHCSFGIGVPERMVVEAAKRAALHPQGDVDQEAGRELRQLIADQAGRAAFLEAHPAVSKELGDLIEENERLRDALAAAPSQAGSCQASDDWQQYAKEGETAQACIERHRREHDCLLSLLAKERATYQNGAAPPAGRTLTGLTLPGFAEVCLDARGWFEGNPDGALSEIEHRARAILSAASTTRAIMADTMREAFEKAYGSKLRGQTTGAMLEAFAEVFGAGFEAGRQLGMSHATPQPAAERAYETPMQEFEDAIRRVGIVAACEWFGYASDSEFTRETAKVLAERGIGQQAKEQT